MKLRLQLLIFDIFSLAVVGRRVGLFFVVLHDVLGLDVAHHFDIRRKLWKQIWLHGIGMID